VIDQGVRLDRGPHAHRDRQRDSENQCEERQFQRCWQAVDQIRGDRLARGERVAEIAVGEVRDIVGELNWQAPVESQFRPYVRDRVGIGRGSGEKRRRIARKGV
jgi:hypothetical protein